FLSLTFLLYSSGPNRALHSFPTRRSSDLRGQRRLAHAEGHAVCAPGIAAPDPGSECTRGDRHSQRPDRSRRAGGDDLRYLGRDRSEEHTSELQSPCNLVCRLLLEKKKKRK